jgi:HemY protein
MRAALWILVLFAAAVAFTLAARLDQGYVIIVYPPWRMELSFMLALLLLAGLVALAYVGLRLANVALNLSGDVRAWRDKRRQTKVDNLDGDFKRAAELAGKAGDSTLAPDLVERLRQPVRVDSVPAPILTKTETQMPTPTA